MAHLVSDDIDRRLRACRPAAAAPDPDAFDAELLARVLAQPLPAPSRPRGRRAAAPVLAGATALAAAAVVLLGGGPGGGPATASAIQQALHWFDPPAGTVLHLRMTEDVNGKHDELEIWQSADDPAQSRTVSHEGDLTFEAGPDSIYDPDRNIIYEGDNGPAADMPGGPLFSAMRDLLAAGKAEVRGRETHDGVDAWAITLKPGNALPAWTLWIAAADGRPLALHEPGYMHAQWTTYEVQQPGAPLTLEAAHPDARVVNDVAEYQAALQRVLGR